LFAADLDGFRQQRACSQHGSSWWTPPTLARKLSDEGLSFAEILQQLWRDLAVR
jgi:hypothetical protein